MLAQTRKTIPLKAHNMCKPQMSNFQLKKNAVNSLEIYLQIKKLNSRQLCCKEQFKIFKEKKNHLALP